MRRATVAAVILGATAALIFRGDGKAHTTGLLFEVWYAIPSGSDGQNVQFNCNWHIVCVAPIQDGPALDWDNSDTTLDIYFRGAFKRGGASGYTLHTVMYPWSDTEFDCHQFRVDIHENHLATAGHGYDHTPRWGVHYYHGRSLFSNAGHSVYTTPTGYGYYNNFRYGYMVIENTDYCDWDLPTCMMNFMSVRIQSASPAISDASGTLLRT